MQVSNARSQALRVHLASPSARPATRTAAGTHRPFPPATQHASALRHTHMRSVSTSSSSPSRPLPSHGHPVPTAFPRDEVLALGRTLNEPLADVAASPLAEMEVLVGNEVLVLDLCEALLAALRRRDFEAVHTLWSELRNFGPGNPSTVNVLPFFKTFAETIEAMGSLTGSIPPHTAQSLDEIAVHAAATMNSRAAEARAILYLDQEKPELVLRLAANVSHTVGSRGQKMTVLRAHFERPQLDMIVERSGYTPVYISMRLALLAAAASCMAKDFAPLLSLRRTLPRLFILQCGIPAIARQYKLPEAELARQIQRLKNLDILTASVDGFRRYVAGVASDTGRPISQLTHLAARVVSELSADDPCLTLDPVKVSTGRHPVFLFPAEHWATLTRGLILMGHVTEAERFWQHMDKLAGRTPPLVHAAIIEGFALTKRFGRARAAWTAVTGAVDTPATVVHHAYIKSLLLEGATAAAMTELHRFEQSLRKSHEHGTSRNDDSSAVLVFNLVLESLVSQGHVDEAWRILDRMKKMGPRPDAESFNSFMEHYRQIKDPRRMYGIMEEMRGLGGLLGDLRTASLLLPALCPVRMDAVELVIAMLRQHGVDFDVDVCAKLLEQIVRVDDDSHFDAAIAVISHIEAHRPELLRSRPNGLCVVLVGIERRTWDEPAAAERFRRILLNKLLQHFPGSLRSERYMLKFVKACLENPRADATRRAMAYYHTFSNLRRKIGEPAVGTHPWARILDHLIHTEQWTLADQLVNDVPRGANISPSMQRMVERVRARDVGFVRGDEAGKHSVWDDVLDSMS